MKTIDTYGKTIEEAVNSGLAEFGCTLDDVEVKILTHPGIFAKAKVQMTYTKGEEKIENKTAQAILRNLENRARQVEKQERKQGGKEHPVQTESRKANKQDTKKDLRAESRQDNKQSKPAPQQQSKQASDQQARPEQNSKGGFRTDFRAQLAAADNSTPQTLPEKRQNTPARAALTPEALARGKEKARAYLETLFKLFGIETGMSITEQEDEVTIELTTQDASIIGYRGETLDTFEYLAALRANIGEEKFIHINLDCCGYRAKRSEALVELALRQADRAVRTGRPVSLEPMGNAARRAIHAALSGRADVITRSEGRDPSRCVVILPKRSGGFNNNRQNRKGRDRLTDKGGNKQGGGKSDGSGLTANED